MKSEMSDTSPEVASRHRAALARLPGAERVRMACDMFDTARTVVLSSLPAEVRNDPIESRVHVFRRFYGRDMDPTLLETTVRLIREAGRDTNSGLRG